MSARSSSFSLGTLVQYAFLAVLAYVLAGAPLLSILSSSDGRREIDRPRNVEISKEKLESLVIPEGNLTCGEHAYRGVYVLSREPLVVYIEGFLTEDECGHVVELSEPLFTPSTVWTSGHERLDPSVRLSEKARVSRDNVVQCIEERARTFQGWRPYVFVERLWAQRYGPGGHYSYHYDWSTATRHAGRVSSFMVWLDADCTGGGTRFPRLTRPGDKSWCRFVECEGEGDFGEEEGQGVTFKPIKGNAVFWENMRSDGTGYEESWHAGLPVKSGTKIGLNIWSWYQEGYDPHAQEQETSSGP
ncbi:hypothetical protein BU26DRAFT_476362 [Trematosphaeria pertusa]|uniref:Fe2OG dioxygenase domain-containing protein n=1 Tax=Trematosphaeria pertusa TaxID=390896 RepID=A0A6A6IYQ1_9PLEO|nr:uncharacterized protein BU26DRAFT_476362 [Trematosphaeria pertusa]KAF2255466.1 hypothetical protein BU26DRAFT_476362 [Trematosphaeria pertusa]